MALKTLNFTAFHWQHMQWL